MKTIFTPKRIIVAALLIISLAVALVFIAPQFTQKMSNETLDDITKPATLPISPTIDQAAPTANNEGTKTIRTGMLNGLNRQSASGDVSLLLIDGAYYIRLEDNFKVSNGPDLFVALGNDGKVDQFVAELKGNSGGQNYKLPADFDPAKYSQVIIHCKAFAYSFGVANLVAQ